MNICETISHICTKKEKLNIIHMMDNIQTAPDAQRMFTYIFK